MLIYGGGVSEGPSDMLQMASAQRRYQGTNWLRYGMPKVVASEYIGTPKVRNLGCGL